jgi:hypothetical protein
LLALLLVAAFGMAATRSSLLYEPLSTEHSRDIMAAPYVQTLQVFRKLERPPPDDVSRVVVLLGNSRIWFAARPRAVESEVAALLPERRVRVENLGVFGSRIGDVEAIARHLERLRPSVVVLALGGEEMLRDRTGRLGHLPLRLFDLGWGDGPIPPHESGGRIDRWLRTAWPLYRLGPYVRMALADRLSPDPDAPAPLPDYLDSLSDFFRYRHGDAAGEVEAAYAIWARSRRFEDYLRYVRAAGSLRFRPRAFGMVAPGIDAATVDALEHLLARLGGGRSASRVLLMPQNPVLDAPEAADFRLPGLSESIFPLIESLAQRYAVPLVDARHWVPATGFFDFGHVLPNLRAFQEPLAREIAAALRAQDGDGGV